MPEAVAGSTNIEYDIYRQPDAEYRLYHAILRDDPSQVEQALDDGACLCCAYDNADAAHRLPALHLATLLNRLNALLQLVIQEEADLEGLSGAGLPPIAYATTSDARTVLLAAMIFRGS